MSDNSQKPVKVTPEPFYQDELDVLEAVLKLEKKYGKELLTEEQRERLEKGRGIRIQPKKMMSEDQSLESAYRIVKGLLRGTDKFYRDYYSDESWNSYSEDEKGVAREEMFKKIYNTTPKEMGFDLYCNFLELS